MPARSGDEYLQGLRDRPGEVWLAGERIPDVTSHPGLSGGARSVAALYDMQLGRELLDEMTYPLPGSHERVGMSFVTPRTLRELEGRRRMMERWARSSGGMLGRTPDYLNVILMARAAAAEFFAGNRPEFGRDAVDYYEHVRDNDLTLTHTLVNVRRTRSSQGTAATHEEAAPRVTDERGDGLVVNGARVLATPGPLSDEILVFPSTVPRTTPGAEKHAFASCVPCDTPGLKLVCRESFDLGRPRFDHPLGSRFEEMDALVIFDDVLVPWERVFLLGDVDRCNSLFKATDAEPHMMHQVVTKNVAKSEFLLGWPA